LTTASHYNDPKAMRLACRQGQWRNSTSGQCPGYVQAKRLKAGEVPLFWACGVTPQAVARASRVPFMITHKPGHMFVSDLTVDEVTKD